MLGLVSPFVWIGGGWESADPGFPLLSPVGGPSESTVDLLRLDEAFRSLRRTAPSSIPGLASSSSFDALRFMNAS